MPEAILRCAQDDPGALRHTLADSTVLDSDEIRIDEPLPFDDLTGRHRHRVAEHRPRGDERVELAPLAAGIYLRREAGEERGVEPPACQVAADPRGIQAD